MPVKQYEANFDRLSAEHLAQWAKIPTAIASDCQDRSMTMHAAIKPLDRKVPLVGQARTVACMVADNSALHAALQVCEPGEVLVADAHGFEDHAVWGGLMTRAAVQKGVGGLVIDGAVRDSDEIIEFGFACFARAVVPRGPHKGFGGSIDRPVACGGLSVAPGDIILGDADGVAVVPLADHESVLQASIAKLKKEQEVLEGIGKGESLAAIYGVPDIEKVG